MLSICVHIWHRGSHLAAFIAIRCDVCDYSVVCVHCVYVWPTWLDFFLCTFLNWMYRAHFQFQFHLLFSIVYQIALHWVLVISFSPKYYIFPCDFDSCRSYVKSIYFKAKTIIHRRRKKWLERVEEKVEHLHISDEEQVALARKKSIALLHARTHSFLFLSHMKWYDFFSNRLCDIDRVI